MESERTAELESQLVHLRERLQVCQKQTALGELLSTTTHEFNNILTTILNYAKIGLRHKDAETRTRAFEKILASSNRAAKITHGILGFARNRGNQFEPTNLAKVVEDSLLLLERELTKHRVSVECDLPSVPRARANTNQIQQVLMNLIINARQAMPQGGRLIIKLSHDPGAKVVELAVRDTGIGMSQDTLHRIFDPYFTTKSGPDATGRGGTGLGLSTVREIIEQHQGKIRVESSPGHGTAISIRLPEDQSANVLPEVIPLGVPAGTGNPNVTIC